MSCLASVSVLRLFNTLYKNKTFQSLPQLWKDESLVLFGASQVPMIGRPSVAGAALGGDTGPQTPVRWAPTCP